MDPLASTYLGCLTGTRGFRVALLGRKRHLEEMHGCRRGGDTEACRGTEEVPPMTATTHQDAQSPLRRLITIIEVADVLSVEVRHVRRLVHERRIPFDAPMDRQVVDGPVSSCR